MTKTLSITSARADLPKLVSNAKEKLDEYIITVNGVPEAILMSIAEFESWKETLEIMADQSLMKAIRQGEADIKNGNVYDWEDVKKELGLDVQNKTYRKGAKGTKRYFQTP